MRDRITAPRPARQASGAAPRWRAPAGSGGKGGEMSSDGDDGEAALMPTILSTRPARPAKVCTHATPRNPRRARLRRCAHGWPRRSPRASRCIGHRALQIADGFGAAEEPDRSALGTVDRQLARLVRTTAAGGGTRPRCRAGRPAASISLASQSRPVGRPASSPPRTISTRVPFDDLRLHALPQCLGVEARGLGRRRVDRCRAARRRATRRAWCRGPWPRSGGRQRLTAASGPWCRKKCSTAVALTNISAA
jgi:hypothetical protein